MANEKVVIKQYSFSLFVLVFIVFLTLKLAEVGQVATWPWWAVALPLWGPFAVLAALVMVLAVVFLFLHLLGVVDLNKK